VLTALYETFLQERRFLKNCSPKTTRSYRQAWDSFESVFLPVNKIKDYRLKPVDSFATESRLAA